MSGRKNRFVRFACIPASEMANNIISAVTNIQGLDNLGYQFDFTGVPVGSFQIQISADYQQDFLQNVTNIGNWIPISLPSTPVASGAAGQIYVDLALLSAPWIRAKWITTATGAQTVTTVADVSGSLAGKYFLMQSANNATNYYFWFKVSGSGTDPLIAGATGEEVDISTNATAAQVATALSAVVNPLADFNSSAVGAVVTVTNAASGPFLPAHNPSTLSAGFTYAVTTGQGTLTGFITGKMI